MASHPPAQCCVEGVKHEGEATGTFKNIGDIDTYFAHPPSKDTTKAIIIFPDVIGHRFVNAQLIADQFAANGYLVAMPDIFHGDPIPLNRPDTFDIDDWRKKHGVETVDPVVEAVIAELKGAYGAKAIGTVGYCFGAKSVVRFLKKGVTDAGYVAHPSFVSEDEVRAVEGPLSIAAAETDRIFPPEKRHATEALLQETGVPYQVNLYSGVQHGFAVRGDMTVPISKYAKEQAFLQAVYWFNEHLKA